MSLLNKVSAVLPLLVFSTLAMAEPAMLERNLNLRSGPGPAFGVLIVMPSGSKVDIQRCNEEWCRVQFGRQIGYASREMLNIGGEPMAQAAPPPAAEKPTPGGARIWQWQDREYRDRHWRELEWSTRHKR